MFGETQYILCCTFDVVQMLQTNCQLCTHCLPNKYPGHSRVTGMASTKGWQIKCPFEDF